MKLQVFILDVARLNPKNYETVTFLLPFRFGLRLVLVHHAARLVNLGLGLRDGILGQKHLARGSHLRGSDTDSLGDGVPGEHLVRMLLEEVQHQSAAGGSLLLLLGGGGLALGVLLVQLLDQNAAGLVHGIGDVSVKNGLEVLASSHDFSFLRFMRLR